MQSWGTQSRFLERDTGLEPSKSGVIGLLCAALGRPRTASVDDLTALTMGIRVDHEGTLRRDYQTAEDVVRADGSRGGTVVSNRYYLADADFLVGLAGSDLALLERIDAALAAPRWPLFLGRKAFVPGIPVRLPAGSVRQDTDLNTALYREAWPTPSGKLRVVLEATPAEATARRIDQPAPGAAFQHRRFVPRHVLIDVWEKDSAPDATQQEEASDV
jgi:CRISPR system Cascade subunit CasD